MQPQDTEALEGAAWKEFVRRLGAHLAGQWPAMPERLGDRYDAFIDLAVQQASQRGLSHAASVARFVNLWFVWGPAFHDKPGFEWAQGILAAPRERRPEGEWLALHQLVQRSLAELQRLPGARIEPQALVAADERVLDTFGPLGRQGAMLRPQPEPLPLRACDLEAADLRLLEDGRHQEYQLTAGDWQRSTVPTPPALRVMAGHPLPKLIGVLSNQLGQGPQARLQLRLRTHAVCHGDIHPAAAFLGPHGRWSWAGHETRAFSWPLATREQPLPEAGPGAFIAEETAPELHKLVIETCGLRDEGEPIGSLNTLVSVWPAAQWWLELQRQAAPAAAVASVAPGATPPAAARGVTRCRVECDGQPRDSTAVRQGFEQGLDDAVAAALQTLLSAWSGVAELAAPRLEGRLALLVGRAAFTWGWRLGPGGLDGRALMRLVGGLEMQACQAELSFEGELAMADARSRVTLRVAAQAPLQLDVRREAPEPALLPKLLPAAVSFRLPFEAEMVPLASDSGSLLQAAGPCTGALVGDAGLRPCTSGASGWEWFAALRLEPVNLPLEWFDPLLGRQSLTRTLLPAQALLDWKLG